MSIERSHGKARPTLPRRRDLEAADADRDPCRGRDEHGRFASGNEAGTGRGWKAIVAKHLGRELQGEAGPLAREALQLFRAELAQMPHDGPQVRQLVAARARSAVLAARYAMRAAELGLDTDVGQKAIELSMRLDARAERLAVTALDIASKLAKAEGKRKPIDVHGRVLDTFGAPGSGSGGAT